MIVYVLLIAYALLKLSDIILGKHFQQDTKMDLDNFILFNVVNSIIACIYFFIAGGFKLELNAVTVNFALAFSIFVALQHVLVLLSYSKVSVSFSGIISTAGSVTVSSVFGMLYFSEAASPRRILSLVLLIAAVFLPVMGAKLAKPNFKSIIICVSFFFVSGIVLIFSKLYADTPGVCNSNSYFFMTNVFLLAGGLVLYFIRRKHIRAGGQKIFTKSYIGNIALRNVLSDMGAVISVFVLASMDIGFFSIATYSSLLIGSILLSKFYFKEKITAVNVISIILAMAAIVMNPS